ncbi:fasciclin domain-containing protein [Sulfitobacter sp. D35]|uniref:fasciclin domain-containing protein n=1 Tax=Sulfitobacter sp. D35 TaxID=3083252 RepID=UPI00296E6217|nr:fasciclin domain-containing protein [Sulfitobacter sp. D35]MDW4497776.1 fasciclin domain-containing protein [Sulfitobacter sp. D35]
MNRRSLFRSAAAAGALALVAGCSAGVTGGGDIVDVASSNDDFSTLVAAVSAADLAETLQGDGPFTVFAPTNEAFAALPAGTVDSLLLPENKAQLVEVLTYHVAPGYYPASALAGAQGGVPTVQGGTLRVDGTNGVKVGNANVITPDVAASNGVIHAIDRVLLP